MVNSSDNFMKMKQQFSELASQQPTLLQQTREAKSNEETLESARAEFVDYVQTGAKAVAAALGEQEIRGESFWNEDNRSRMVTGFVLRKRLQYGSLEHPQAHYFGTWDFGIRHSASHNRKLIITANAGELMIVGYNAGSYGVENHQPAPSHWFHEKAIQGPEDLNRLKQEAQNDFENTVKHYSRQR